MKQITIDAPCKINLSLDIVRRLENGYHEMDMVMQSVSLYDTLTLSLQEGSGQIRMTCSLENKNASLPVVTPTSSTAAQRLFFMQIIIGTLTLKK